MRRAAAWILVTTTLGAGCGTSTSTGSGPGSEPAPTASAAAATGGDEAEQARRIDSLVAEGRIGEAHAAAMVFVQSHPSGPYSRHVMNLMGVHPRPPGAVPPPRDTGAGR